MFPRYQDYNLQGDGSLLIVRQSAREGRSKRTRRCIPDGFSFFFSFFETKRVSIGKLWLVVFFGSSASQAKDHLVTGSLKGFRAARPIRVYPGGELERYWRLTPAQGSHHPFMGRHLHHGQVLHQSNTHPPPAPQHQPPTKIKTKDKAPVGTKNTHQPFIKPLAPKPQKRLM